MPNRRIVQDSDEEDNANDSPIKELDHASAHNSSYYSNTGAQQVSSPQTKQLVASAGPSTGSTGTHVHTFSPKSWHTDCLTSADTMAIEALHREIKDAYNSLLEPSTSRSSRSSHPSSGSPSLSKRTATTDFGVKQVKPSRITYGAKKSQAGSTTQFNSEDEEPSRPKKRVRKSTDAGDHLKDGLEEDNRYLTSSSSFDGPGKPGGSGGSPTHESVGEHGRELHDGSIIPGELMPPPALRSSGASQQQVQSSEGSTIPFTDRASSPPAADHETFISKADISNKRRSTLLGASDLETSSPAKSRTRKRAISELESPKIILGEEIPPSSSAPAESPIKRARVSHSKRDHAIPMSPRKSDGGHDELSLSVTNSPSSNRKNTSASKANSKAAPAQTQSAKEADDDLLPDIPAEHYQPRPSRCRSAFAADDLLVPTDFSKRPEALAKSKIRSKRRKTTAFQTSEQFENESPKPLPAADTLPSVDLISQEDRKANGDLNAHENHPEVPTIIPDEHARKPSPPPKPPPKKSRGRPKKDVHVPQQTVEEIPKADTHPSNPADNPESSTIADLAPTPAPAPTKRGRKRKKTISEEIVQDEAPLDSGELVQQKSTVTTDKILTDIDINIQPSPRDQEEEEEGEEEATQLTNPLPNQKQQLPLKIEIPEGKKKVTITNQSSPANENGGKATYRVGLSKRQRIAPLLRVVKK